MPPFKFRLEQVRLYRKQLEEQAMQALARALMNRNALQARIRALHETISEQRLRLSHPETLPSAELWLLRGYETAMKAELEQARKSLAEAEDIVNQCQVDVVQKAKDRGLLDSLKEKQANRHILRENKQEQRSNDETATVRYKSAAV